MTIRLPHPDRSLVAYELPEASPWMVPEGWRPESRVAYAAAHVVSDAFAGVDPVHETAIDWDATLEYRRHLWSLGLSVAEAMDTAQRGTGLDWSHARELIRRSVAEARAVSGGIACGANTDHLDQEKTHAREEIIQAYEEQCEFIEACGGRVILMASRALARCARGPDDYARVYGRVLSQLAQPAILHWLGHMFDPALAGYWGSQETDAAMRTALDIIAEHRASVDGIKISLLDTAREVEMRRLLPSGVRMYTGDDFHYPELIEGGSDALLGIFDAIAPAAAAALRVLDAGDREQYRAILDPTLPLSRHIFHAPTYAYKTGIVFLAWLTGHQQHFRMIAGAESARSLLHLSELFRLAGNARLFPDPALAAQRMRTYLAVHGIAA